MCTYPGFGLDSGRGKQVINLLLVDLIVANLYLERLLCTCNTIYITAIASKINGNVKKVGHTQHLECLLL